MNSLIKSRHSIRKYQNKDVDDKIIKDILDAAMHAPSARNQRPWHFIVIKNKDILNEICKLSPYMQMMKEASFAIMPYSLKSFEELKSSYEPQDFGACIQNMLLEANSHDVGSCWCGIYPNVERTKLFKDYFKLEATPIALIAFGYKNEEVETRGFYDETKVKYLI